MRTVTQQGLPPPAQATPGCAMVLLFVFAWPIFVLWWWLNPDSRPQWVRNLIANVRAYPKRWACFGIAFGLIGGIGNVREDLGAAAFGVVVAIVCGVALWRVLARERAAAAEIAARADT